MRFERGSDVCFLRGKISQREQPQRRYMSSHQLLPEVGFTSFSDRTEGPSIWRWMTGEKARAMAGFYVSTLSLQ